MIKTLIIKDFIIQKKTALFGLAYSILLLALFSNTTYAASVYILCTVAISYLLIMGAVAHDEKSNIILNSLPVKRSTIVLAKYVSIFVFGLGALLCVGALGALLKAIGLPFPARYLDFTDVFAAFFSLGLVSALYLPFYYRFGYISSRVFHIIFFMLAFFGPSTIISLLQERYGQENLEQILNILSGLPGWQAMGILIALVLLVVLVSYQVSLRFYKRRDF